MKYKRIRIVGASGSGKTYLAVKLANKINYPLMKMDEIRFDFTKTSKFKHQRPEKVRDKMFDDFIKKNKKWVVDGSYFSWKPENLDQADLIICLDVPILKRTFRTIRRYFKNYFAGSPEGLRSFFELLKYNLTDGRRKFKERPKFLLKKYRGKTKIFSSADEAFEWFKQK